MFFDFGLMNYFTSATTSRTMDLTGFGSVPTDMGDDSTIWWGKPVHVILFIRTLLIVLMVAVCTVVAVEELEALGKKAEAGDALEQNNLGLI